MKKIIVLTSLMLFSLNTFAGYECHLSLSHIEELDSVIAEKTIFATDQELKTTMHKDFFIEAQSKNKKTSIDVRIVSVGWNGEEEMTFVPFRNNEKKSKSKVELIGDKRTIVGNANGTLWFDQYKLDMDCNVI